MGKSKNISIIFGAIVIVLVAALFFQGNGNRKQISQNTPSVTVASQNNDTISYQGITEKDALSILKERATVSQNSSGLVTEINGRKADNSKHEYWAFYINGKMASVGPADYKTKNEDLVEWKIEKY